MKKVFLFEDREQAEKLFKDWPETLIWSCLQGIMGNIYTDNPEGPDCAVAVLGDFAFFAGRPSKALLLGHEVWRKQQGVQKDFMILTPQNRDWEKVMEDCYGPKIQKAVRYAIKKEGDIFDKERLREVVKGLPEQYELRFIDRELYEYCKKTQWCEDFISNYATAGEYERLGLGVMILKDGIPVSGASSYSSYQDGIEIEIDTRKDFRRRGLAYAAGAALILECLERGLYPSWDAHNKASVALARKLGYHYSHEYTVFEAEF